jgi:hypothetical protein
MGCKATKLNVIFVLIIAFCYALLFTSKVTAETLTNTDYPERTISFEVKPVSLLVNLVPGARGFAGEFEASLGKSISVVAGLNHLSLNLPEKSTEDQKDGEVTEIERKISASEVSLGGRYYNNMTGHSWFVGSRIGGGTKKSVWDHSSEEYVDSQMTYHTAVETGFRWLWKNSLHLRLGGGLEMRRTISRTISHLSDDSSPDEISRSIEKKNPTDGIRINPYFDFGFGVTI